MKYLQFILLFGILFIEFAYGNNSEILNSRIPIIRIETKTRQIENFNVGLIVDKQQTATIEDIAAKIGTAKIVNSRYQTPANCKINTWFIFTIKNTSDTTLSYYVRLDEVYLDDANLYYKKNEQWICEKNGQLIPYNQRKIKNRLPVFEVKLLPQESRTLFLMTNTLWADHNYGIVIEAPFAFHQTDKERDGLYMFFFGGVAAIILFNIFLLIFIRELVNLYYVLFGLLNLLWIILGTGIVYISPELDYSLSALIPIAFVFLLLFTREFLRTSQLLDKILLIAAGIFIVFGVLVFYDVANYRFFRFVRTYAVWGLLIVGVLALFKKERMAVFYLLALGGYLVGVSAIQLAHIGLFPINAATKYGYIAGSMIELILFSFALGYKYKIIHDEKKQLYTQLLVSEQNTKKQLKQQVKERTKELVASNNKLIDLTKFRENISTMLVHDLKSPLGIIMSMTNDNIIQNAASQMFRLITNLIDVQRFEQLKIQTDKRRTELHNLINASILQFEFIATKKNISLINNSKNCTIYIDKELIIRVFDNLISNALKFAPIGKEIIIDNSFNDNELTITVSNEGEVIPEELLSKIFEKFVNTTTSTTHNSFSSGIGLAFCKLAIEAHKGKIGVESKAGEAVKFWFTIPFAEKLAEIEPSGKQVLNSEKNKNRLNKNDLKVAHWLINELKEIEIYEETKFRKVLNEIDNVSKDFNIWLDIFKEAHYNMEQETFNEKIQELTNYIENEKNTHPTD